MHGVRLAGGVPGSAKKALPLLALNSVTMLGAEICGRSYGGGILKMEPREAAVLPLPDTEALERAWTVLAPHNDRLDAELGRGRWSEVVTHVDQTLLVQVLGLSQGDVAQLREAASTLRARRTGKSEERP